VSKLWSKKGPTRAASGLLRLLLLFLPLLLSGIFLKKIACL
jgi:hypothetical protein